MPAWVPLSHVPIRKPVINMIESNRLDSIQDFVNAFDVFQNCELENGQYKELAKGGNGNDKSRVFSPVWRQKSTESPLN